jgi:hypothetical protein
MATPEEDIEFALFNKAMAYTDLPLMFQNEYEDPPVTGAGHVVVKHFRNGSRAMSLAGEGDDFNIGILQMMIRLPLGRGSPEMRKRGGDIVALFWTPANLVLTRNTTKVKIAKRPVLGTAITTDKAYQMVVSIEYEVSI